MALVYLAYDTETGSRKAVNPVSYNKQKFVLGTNLTYLDLEHQILDNSVIVSIGRLMAHQGDDFSISTVDGVTRITWIGELADTENEMALEAGDVVYVSYAYVSYAL